MLEFRVLGPVEARGGDGIVALRGRKQTVLLATLLLRADQFVSRQALIDALWAEDPPVSAGSTLEVYVSRLRGALRAAGGDAEVIQSGPAGYRFHLGSSWTDIGAFERLALSARAALERGDAGAAVEEAGAALRLWRGPALAGVADQSGLRADADVLEERRVGVLETLAQAAVQVGGAAETIPLLQAEVARNPGRERLRALLMISLYREDRQADALEVFQETRRYLVRELGLEPSCELRDLQERILRQDPSLAVPRIRPPGGEAAEAKVLASSAKRRRRKWTLGAVAAISVATALALGVAALAAGGGGSGIGGTLRSAAVGVLDPVSGQPRATVPLGVVATRVTMGGGADWASSYDDGTLLRIDPHRLLVTQTVDVGHGATGVAVGAGDAWVALSLDGMLSRVDLSTNTVVQRIRVGTDPTEIAAGNGDVWVSNTGDGTVSRIDAHTGGVLSTTPVGPSPEGIAVGAGAVWVADSAANMVVRISPVSGRVQDRIPVGQGPGQIVVGADGVWVANDLDSTVSLIDPSSDAVTLTRAVSGVPIALAPAGQGAWVAAGDRPILTFIDASGASRQVELPSPPTSLAHRARGLLVAVRGIAADHRGGTLVVRTQGPLATADPASCCDLPPNVRNLTYDGLLGISKLPGSAGTLVPDLALAIPRAESGGLLYTFRLRPGLRYSNGRPVRASDFIRGFERAASSSDVWAGYIGSLAGALSCPGSPRTCDLSKAVIANDRARTLTLQLSHPDPNLLLALGLSAFAPAPQYHGGFRPGTGPYRVIHVIPNHQIILERNPYFRPWAPIAQPAGYPDRIVVDSGASNSADITAVLAGRADYTWDTPAPAQLTQIELHEPGQLHISPLPELDFLFLNTRARPFRDVRVRQALNYAVNRAAIVALTGGPATATPACQIIPATIPGHKNYCRYTRAPSPSGRWIGPDLKKARALLAASRARGEAVSVLTQPSGLASDEPTARYIVALLRQLGFHARLRLLPAQQWQTAIDDYRHPAQIGTDTWGVDFISASQFLTTQLSCAAWKPPAALGNHAQFCDPHVDRLAQHAAQLEQTSPIAANALWARADRLATDMAPWLPTVSENEIDLVSRRVGNYHYVACGACSPIDQMWIR